MNNKEDGKRNTMRIKNPVVRKLDCIKHGGNGNCKIPYGVEDN
jgi:hypothetical protein